MKASEPERADLTAWRARNELRQGSRAQPVRNRKKYNRKSKYKNKDYS